jgi:hypothetical protein
MPKPRRYEQAVLMTRLHKSGSRRGTNLLGG